MFRVCAKKMLQKNLVKEHAGFVDQNNKLNLIYFIPIHSLITKYIKLHLF